MQMKISFLLVCLFVAAFVDVGKSQEEAEANKPLATTFERLIKSEFIGIVDNFFTFVKEIVKTVTEERSQPTPYPETTQAPTVELSTEKENVEE